MNTVIIIPARMGSSRFPGKPLYAISDLPMVMHCYYRAQLALGKESVYIATCDDEISEVAKSLGARVVMTSNSHNRASDRTAEAMIHLEKSLGKKIDVVVMIQGDEPLIRPEAIVQLCEHFKDENKNSNIANIMSRIHSEKDFLDVNNVKVVVNCHQEAMYFSREPIPSPWHGTEGLPMWMQVGAIAFSRSALLEFNEAKETNLEIIESIDMNRVLEGGGEIKMYPTEWLTIGVDTVEEAIRVEELMKSDQIYREYSSWGLGNQNA